MDLPVINDVKRETGTAPTDDGDVRIELRKLGEPITLFGEGKSERRQRLLTLLAEKPHTNFAFALLDQSEDESMEEEDDDDFYTPGSEELLDARKEILAYSMKRARERLEKQKKAAAVDSAKVLKHRRHINHQLSQFQLDGTYTLRGNTRAVSSVRLNRTGTKLACGSWDGNFYILEGGQDFKQISQSAPRHHSEKVTVHWSPNNDDILVSGGAEGTLNVWKVGQEPITKPTSTIKEAHAGRIANVVFHPNTKHVATTSFDQTWKLWDIEKGTCLLEQEGHSKEVFAGSFQGDGSLFASGGLDAVGRIWDLRSGRSVAVLESHVQGIYSMDWAPNGYHLASASGDCSVKIWDMRKLSSESKEIFSIPAHTKLVSEVRFLNGAAANALSTDVTDENGEYPEKLDMNGTYLATTSYDGTVKLWSSDNWVAAATLRGHTDKVMGCDVGPDGLYVVSCGWDRTVRTWKKL